MKFAFFIKHMAGGLAFASMAVSAFAQINLPNQRDDVIAAGQVLLAARGGAVPSDKNAPDPFIGKVEPVAAEVPTLEVPVVRAIVNEAELLQKIANQMSARGTAIMGDDRFLLLSQKRLKVGDSITINFDGKDYEVWLAEVTSTTFTIRRNSLSYTRAVMLPR